MSSPYLLKTKDAKSFCQISQIGCGIENLTLRGHRILWSGKRPDGGYGFTHICAPNFREAAGLPQHGPARKDEWQSIEMGLFRWQMKEIAGVYPGGLTILRKHELREDQFKVNIEVANQGNEPVSINLGEHAYFDVDPRLISKIKINNFQFGDAAANDDTQYIAAESLNRLSFPNRFNLELQLEGFNYFALWSLANAEYACIEPIERIPNDPQEYFRDLTLINPGQSKTYSYNLRLL